jgi:hypothetical protein
MRTSRTVRAGLIALGSAALLCAASRSALTQDAAPRLDTPAASSASGYLKRSDVVFSPRFYRKDWKRAFDAFHANKIVWTYAGPQYIKETAGTGISVQCTFPFWVPATEPDVASMACMGKTGKPLTIELAGGTKLTYADVNTKAWRKYQLTAAKALYDQGCRHFHQDDPTLNAGRLIAGGCNSVESIEARRRAEPSRKGSEAETIAAADRKLMVSYHAWLQQEIRDYAKIKGETGRLTFSGNLTNHQLPRENWLLSSFDFLQSEIYAPAEKMRSELVRFAQITGSRAQPTIVAIVNTDPSVLRRAIPTAYALGLLPIAPWDVYISPKLPRFYGTPQDYAHLYEFVRGNSRILDDYQEPVFARGAAAVVADGYVTGVDSASFSDKILIHWAGRSANLFVKVGTRVLVGGKSMNTVSDSKIGHIYVSRDQQVPIGAPVVFGADEFLVTVRRGRQKSDRTAVHVVNWGAPRDVYVVLAKEAVPTVPNQHAAPDRQVGSIKATLTGQYYSYFIRNLTEWSILHSAF